MFALLPAHDRRQHQEVRTLRQFPDPRENRLARLRGNRTPALRAMLTADPGVLGLGANLMLLAAAFQIFDAMSISYGSALRGAGDTKWPAIVLAAYCYGIVIAGGWLLTVARPELGSYGPWIMCTIYAIVLSLTLRYRWVRGEWQKIDIFAGGRKAVLRPEG